MKYGHRLAVSRSVLGARKTPIDPAYLSGTRPVVSVPKVVGVCRFPLPNAVQKVSSYRSRSTISSPLLSVKDETKCLPFGFHVFCAGDARLNGTYHVTDWGTKHDRMMFPVYSRRVKSASIYVVNLWSESGPESGPAWTFIEVEAKGQAPIELARISGTAPHPAVARGMYELSCRWDDEAIHDKIGRRASAWTFTRTGDTEVAPIIPEVDWMPWKMRLDSLSTH